MRRDRQEFLKNWVTEKDRKPLVIRGARQVGKTWLVRELAKSSGLKLIEINFERQPEFAALFETNDPKKILLALESHFNETINPEQSLMFLDEIQAAPMVFAKLRWFYEELPSLAVVAAGSLLEFLLSNHSFSMPVGRISYLHLEPFSFGEFLQAIGKDIFRDYLKNIQIDGKIPDFIHNELMGFFREYVIVGGMPACVSKWRETKSLQAVNKIQYELIATYRDDFPKYKGRIDIDRLNEVMLAVPRHLGEKFVWSKVNPAVQTPSIKQALNLIVQAKLCHRVQGVHANGIPLEAEIDAKFLKCIFLDVGLASAALGLSLNDVQSTEELIFVNSGGIAEQVAGQLLRTLFPPYIEPALYYWHREEPGSNAEVDYVIQHQNKVIPVEVKAGKGGGLKSLHLFMAEKKSPFAVRIYSERVCLDEIETKERGGGLWKYKLLSVPFYLVGELGRLVKEAELRKSYL